MITKLYLIRNASSKRTYIHNEPDEREEYGTVPALFETRRLAQKNIVKHGGDEDYAVEEVILQKT